MKKLFTLSLAAVLIYMCGAGIHSNPTGAPAGVAGGPADQGITCTQVGCHNVAPSAVTGYITTDIPASGWVAGRTYNLTVSFGGTGKKGFEVSPQDSIGGYVGKLISGTGSQIVGTNYITHTNFKSTTTATWAFQWKAPARGRGKFSFYGAFAITQNSTKKTSVTVIENKSLPVITTTPAAPVYNIIATINAIAHAHTGAYTTSFQYKAEGGSWTFVNATPSNISGDSAVAVKLNLTSLTPGTRYVYRACMWNAGDTTWGDTLSFTTSLTSGLAKQNITENISIYPQPVAEVMNLRFQLNTASEVIATVFNLNGEEMLSNNLGKMNAGINEAQLANKLPKGIYLLRLKAADEMRYLKFISE